MSKRNQFVGTPALILSTAIFLLALVWIGNIISDNWVSIHEANAAYQQNAENDRRQSAIEIADTCYDRPTDDFRKCVGDNLESHYRDQATNEDLQAQQDMAFWAFWLLVASALGIFISGIGVFLLIRSIGLGREANIESTRAANEAAASNEIMRQSQRPWLIVEVDHDGEIELTDEGFTEDGKLLSEIWFVIRNVGGSSAVVDGVYRRWSVCDGDPPLPEPLKPGWRKKLATQNIKFVLYRSVPIALPDPYEHGIRAAPP